MFLEMTQHHFVSRFLFLVSTKILGHSKISNLVKYHKTFHRLFCRIYINVSYSLRRLSMCDTKESAVEEKDSRDIALPTLMEMTNFIQSRPSGSVYFRLYILVKLFTLNESTNIIIIKLSLISQCMH